MLLFPLTLYLSNNAEIKMNGFNSLKCCADFIHHKRVIHALNLPYLVLGNLLN